ncbi:hypothetical protein LJC48_00740 [Desulfovibrio sp. OttesenSCG-928-C06]|nr:hypothetical protein [Desulfovibrio sp. OttesenSCG-928-C06]
MKNTEQAVRNLRHAEELILFEQWMRFYFIEEEDGIIYMRMPHDVFELVHLEFPSLFPVAEALNSRPVDHQATLAILSEAMLHGEYALSNGQWAEVLGGSGFKLTLTLLATWVEAEEDNLDAEPISFAGWLERFEVWRRSEPIVAYAAKLRAELDKSAMAAEDLDTEVISRIQ